MGGTTTATGLPVAGVTVNFTATGDSRTGVTDSSGNVTFSSLAALTYTRTAVAPDSRFVTTSASAAVTCGTTGTLPITFNIASGYTCGDPSEGTPCSPRPVKTTLFLTDPVLGVVTLTASGGSWSGSLSASVANVRDSSCLNPATRNVTVQYTIQAVSPIVSGHYTQWQLTILVPFCVSGGVHFPTISTGASSDQVQGTSTSGGCPETAAVSVPVSFAAAPNSIKIIYGTGTLTFSFSE